MLLLKENTYFASTDPGSDQPRLLQHCARLTVSDSSCQARQSSALAAADIDHDPGVAFLATMVKAAGLELTLRDITGPIRVPFVACASPAGETVYGSGAKLAEAVTQALTAALFRYQTQTDPVLKSATSIAPPAIWVNPASAESLNPDRLVSALTGLGYLPSVFGLDHDPAVSAAFPYVLRVTLVAMSSTPRSQGV